MSSTIWSWRVVAAVVLAMSGPVVAVALAVFVVLQMPRAGVVP